MRTLRIATACFLNDEQELLVVRKQNTTAWMLPGGKLDAHESSSEALVREVREELQLDVAASELHFIGSFDAVAANEADTAVNAQAFLVRWAGPQVPRIAAEIAEMKWLPLNQSLPEDVAPLLRDCIIPSLVHRFAR